jgi:GNAT superfamily N-acetyltransferase
MPSSFTISDLRQRPEFFDVVADRIWQAWWKADGHPLAAIATRLKENLDAAPIPFALVAHREAEFLGTASVIESDLAERPQYSPWVAAVWVDPAFRGSGVGAAVVARAANDCFALGFGRAYLCARPDRTSFYTGLGWVAIEQGIGEKRLSVFVRDAKP